MYKLVLIEDDYQIRTGLSNFFPWANIGYDLTCSFENGRQALDFILRNPQIDVVLTDIKMPVMDGLQFAGELKKINPDTLVVFLTAYRDFNYAYQAVNMGVKNYILKSTKYDELITVFQNIKASLDEHQHVRPPHDSVLPAAESSRDDQIIRKIKEYVKRNLRDATLQSVAEYVKMSPVYLSRYFKKKTGINFIDYIIQAKMEKAAELLKESRMKILNISELVGYSNEKNFSRAFKKYFGISPVSYREISE